MIALILVLAFQTQTICNQVGTSTICNTTPPPPTFRPIGPPVEYRGAGSADAAGRARLDAVASGERARSRAAEQERELGYIPGCASRFWLLAECSRRQHDEAVAGLARRDALATLRTVVTQKLADGDCPGAVRAALEGGEMGLAREAREFCQP